MGAQGRQQEGNRILRGLCCYRPGNRGQGLGQWAGLDSGTSDPRLEGHTTPLPTTPALTLCCHHLGIFHVLTSDPPFSLCTGPDKLCHHPASRLEIVPGLGPTSEPLLWCGNGVAWSETELCMGGQAGA